MRWLPTKAVAIWQSIAMGDHPGLDIYKVL